MKSILPLPSYTGQSVTVYPHMSQEMCLCLEAKDTNHALIFTFCFSTMEFMRLERINIL